METLLVNTLTTARKISMFIFDLIFMLFVSFMPCLGIAATEIGADYNVKFIANFDNGVTNELPTNSVITNYGGAIIPDGLNGSALRLNTGNYITIEGSSLINSQEGTIAFWVRPHWNYKIGESHTFLSCMWDTELLTYFVITNGWWEETTNSGPKNTYAIFSNRDGTGFSLPKYYRQGEWIHFAITWSMNDNVKLYINGALARESDKLLTTGYTPKGEIFIGTDKNNYMQNGRWADSDFDELLAFNRKLTDEEIRQFYEQKFPYTPEVVSGNVKQIRMILDEGTNWATEEGARKVIDDISKTNFNVYVPCVWHGSGSRYKSDIVVQDDRIASLENVSVDPLQRVIEYANAKNIEVHPWIVVADRNRDFLDEYYDGSPEGAFNVHRPEFRKFITDLAIELANKYHIGGIVLDYIRSKGVCTAEFCINDYKNKFGRDLMVDKDVYLDDGSREEHVQKWLDSSVADIVKSVSSEVKKINSNIKISVCGAPRPSVLPPHPEGRREVVWANNGYIDMILNMDYSQTPDFERIDFVKAEIPSSVKLIELVGNYEKEGKGAPVFSRDASILNNIMSYCLLRWPDAVGLYWYDSLNTDQITALTNDIFRNQAILPWQENTNILKPKNLKIVE